MLLNQNLPDSHIELQMSKQYPANMVHRNDKKYYCPLSWW